MPEQNQRIQKARAIVIKEKSVGESNKRLTLFAKDAGKMIVSVRGAKNPKSKFLAGAQQFCYCDFMLYGGGEFLAVTQIELIRNFSAEYSDILKLMYGSYFLELVDKTVMLSQEANGIMVLLLNGLHILGTTDNPKKVSAAFQIKLLELLGFSPDMALCAKCGKSIEKTFFTDYEGFVCESCEKKERSAAAVFIGVLEAFEYIKEASVKKLFMFNASENVLEQLNCIAESLVRKHLEIESSSLEIITKL